MKSNRTPLESAARDRLLAASVELFTSKGYAGTSVREIVTAAGVTKPVLYYYFGSKEGIYLELMESIFRQFQEILSYMGTAGGSARHRIVRFATDVFDRFVQNVGVVKLIYSIYFGPPQGAPAYPLERYYEIMLDVVADLVREGVAAGEFREVDVPIATWAVISSMNTIMEEQLCHNPPRIGRDGLVQTISLILDGISNGGTR